MNRRASYFGTFEVFEAAHVALRTLLAFSQPVNCIFWPIGMLYWLVVASKLHKHREACCTAEWPFYSFLILCLRDIFPVSSSLKGNGKPVLRRGFSNLKFCVPFAQSETRWGFDVNGKQSLFTLLRHIPDYFLYHLQSGVIFTPRTVPDWCGVVSVV